MDNKDIISLSAYDDTDGGMRGPKLPLRVEHGSLGNIFTIRRPQT